MFARNLNISTLRKAFRPDTRSNEDRFITFILHTMLSDTQSNRNILAKDVMQHIQIFLSEGIRKDRMLCDHFTPNDF